MEFKQHNYSKSFLKRNMPGLVADIADDDDAQVIFFSAEEEGKSIGYIMYYYNLADGKTVRLLDTSVSPLHRRKGVMEKLIDFSENRLCEMGTHAIRIQSIVPYERAEVLFKIFTKQEFIPILLSGRYLVYRYKDLLASDTLTVLGKNRGKIVKCRTFSRENEMDIMDFVKEEYSKGLLLTKGQIRSKYTIYSGKEDIEAVLPVTVMNNMAIVYPFHGAKEGMSGKMFLPMFEESIHRIVEDYGDNIQIGIILTDNEIYEGLEKVFNPPDEDYLYQSYLKVIEEEDE